jgi:TldD protein
MDSLIAQAERRLLAPGGIAASDLDRVFNQLMGPSIDAADLYFQHSRSESWLLEEGIVKDGSHSIEQGVGVRAISGEKTGFAYSDEIVMPQLLDASRASSIRPSIRSIACPIRKRSPCCARWMRTRARATRASSR